VQVGPIRNRVANVDSDTKADSLFRRLVAIQNWDLLLHFQSTPHSPINAIENNERGVAAGLHDLAAMFFDSWVDQVRTQSAEPFERPLIVDPDEAAVANHVGVHDRDELSPIPRLYACV
jgi:hypothetical protein